MVVTRSNFTVRVVLEPSEAVILDRHATRFKATFEEVVERILVRALAETEQLLQHEVSERIRTKLRAAPIEKLLAAEGVFAE